MTELNDDWLTWPPDALDSFFKPSSMDIDDQPPHQTLVTQPEKTDATPIKRLS